MSRTKIPQCIRPRIGNCEGALVQAKSPRPPPSGRRGAAAAPIEGRLGVLCSRRVAGAARRGLKPGGRPNCGRPGWGRDGCREPPRRCRAGGALSAGRRKRPERDARGGGRPARTGRRARQAARPADGTAACGRATLQRAPSQCRASNAECRCRGRVVVNHHRRPFELLVVAALEPPPQLVVRSQLFREYGAAPRVGPALDRGGGAAICSRVGFWASRRPGMGLQSGQRGAAWVRAPHQETDGRKA